jgi:hypothetical protein
MYEILFDFKVGLWHNGSQFEERSAFPGLTM